MSAARQKYQPSIKINAEYLYNDPSALLWLGTQAHPRQTYSRWCACFSGSFVKSFWVLGKTCMCSLRTFKPVRFCPTALCSHFFKPFYIVFSVQFSKGCLHWNCVPKTTKCPKRKTLFLRFFLETNRTCIMEFRHPAVILALNIRMKPMQRR